MVSHIYKILERRFEEAIAGVCVMIMCAMVFLHVVLRYVFNEPLSWSDEIAQYMMLWSVYLSVSWAVRERAHIPGNELHQSVPKDDKPRAHDI